MVHQQTKRSIMLALTAKGAGEGRGGCFLVKALAVGFTINQ